MLAPLLLACSGGETTSTPDPTDVASTDAPADTAHSGDSSTPDSCSVVPMKPSVAVTTGPLVPTDRLLTVTLDVAATVAALCTADDDPAEQHLVESSSAATTHELRFAGLLPDTTYTCRVAATCPVAESGPIEVSFDTGPSPHFPRLQVTVEDPKLGMKGWWTVLPYLPRGCAETPRYLVMYDGEGRARWWYRLPRNLWIDVEALIHPEDNLLVWGGGTSNAGRPHGVDLWKGDAFVADFEGWADHVFTHDGKRLPDGRLLMLDERMMGVGPMAYKGFGIMVLDPGGPGITIDLDSQRYVDEGWLENPLVFNDPYHANWVDLVDDVIYLSLCNDHSLMSFDAATGDVRWKVEAGAGWTVLDADGNVLGDDALPQCTHGNEVLGPDDLLVYDNGQERHYSRVGRWKIDGPNKTATMLSSWTEPGWYEHVLGDVDLMGDRLLITKSQSACTELPDHTMSIVEVDQASGKVASRITFPDPFDTSYRSERYDGCALMASLKACPALAERADALASILGQPSAR